MWTRLTDRAVLLVGGADARDFLQGLITVDMATVDEKDAAYAALLTPQGKVQFDFLISAADGAYRLDVPAGAASDLLKRLTFYRLRAAVELADISADCPVHVAWSTDGAPVDRRGAFADPRLNALGCRWYGAAPEGDPEVEGDWHAHRIRLGVPEAPRDFAYGEVFPHDIDMDDLSGVDFDKGCFVGQEVVSRMRHRGSARKRVITVSAEAPLPEAGSDILAGDRVIGRLASHDGTRGLALIRLDRLAAGLRSGAAITVDGISLEASIQDWATFSLTPDDAEPAA